MELIDILNKSKIVAFNSLKNFCRILDLDSNLFNHIFDIRFEIGKTEDNASAEYMPQDFVIIISKDYLEYMKKILETSNDESNIGKVYLNIALTIVHEMIHANRTIIIEEGISATSIGKEMDKKSTNNFELEKYEGYLDRILEQINEEKFGTFIPISVVANENGLLIVVAYNKNNKNYEVFKNQKFKSNLTNGMFEEYIKNLGKELDNNDFIPDYIVSCATKNYAMPRLASDYYHGYDKKLDNNLLKNEIELSRMLDRLENQSNFEEVITETLAIIIIMSRNSNILDLEYIDKKIANNEERIDVKLFSKLLCALGPKAIRQFMISVYDSNYDSKLEKIFKEEFENLLYDFSDIYQALIYGEEPNEISVNEVNKIIDKKTKNL